MGKEYRTRLKESYGKDAVVAYSTVLMGATALASGALTAASLADAMTNTTYETDRPTKLDGITVNIDGALGVGETLSVNALVDAVRVGVASLVEGDTSADVMFTTELEEEVRLIAGQVITLTADKSVTASAIALSARVSLRLLEN